MGIHHGISATDFPVQGDRLGTRVRVCFRYDPPNALPGVIVRDDRADPWRTIIRLDDGRYVLADECQYADADAGVDVYLSGHRE